MEETVQGPLLGSPGLQAAESRCLSVLDLFSGIGGFSLGLERTGGFTTVAFCEIDRYCRRVLAKHWPGIHIFGDIRELTAQDVAHSQELAQRKPTDQTYTESTGGRARDEFSDSGIDVICGGFPCQDISYAGQGAGLAGERSGLWREFARLVGELRPRYVIVENVPALFIRGFDQVLGDLASLGFDAEWHCIPASYVGAPHRRDRIWVIAYPHGGCLRRESAGAAHGREISGPGEQWQLRGSGSGAHVAHADGGRCEHGRGEPAHAHLGQTSEAGGGHWRVEPHLGRVAHGVPARVDRLRALGNAIVPQVAELLGRAILRHARMEARP